MPKRQKGSKEIKKRVGQRFFGKKECKKQEKA